MGSDSSEQSSSRDGTARAFGRRSVLRTAGAGAVALATVVGGSAAARVAKSAEGGGTQSEGGDGTREAESEDGGETPQFHCFYVDLSGIEGEDVRVTFTDGSYVATADGIPNTLGSPGRVVDEVTVGETTYANPDTDCDAGEKATTFTCRCVTVEREEFARFFGDAPPADLTDIELLFADGTTEQLDPSTDSTGTFRGTGENRGKLLAGLRLWHAAFSTLHVWRNPLVDGGSEPSAD